MKILVVGLGIQGNKRKKIAGKDFIGSVDPFNKKADFHKLKEVPLNSFDVALVCTPDKSKFNIVKYCLKNKKHVLLEKPLLEDEKKIKELQRIALKNKLICYTAYNHRFEPHVVKLRELIRSKKLGKIYYCRVFYGNGTARLVRNSWRDKKTGIVSDIGSHLLDTCAFWFGKKIENFNLISQNKFENNSPDHAIINCTQNKIKIEMEMSYCMWRNNFTCDVIGQKGSAHISSLCKWGPSIFTYRKRVYPSGKPYEYKTTLKCSDPTWNLEYQYFKKLINSKKKTDLSNDLWIYKKLNQIVKNI